MQIYDLSDKERGICLTEEKPESPVMVLGFFDGVHRGHKALINASKEYARWMKAPVCVWTFPTMPKAERVITTPEERLGALAGIGIQAAVFEDFDEVRGLTPDEFFEEYLVKTFAPRAVYCGFNFRYGKDAAGSADTLRSSAAKHGIPVFVLPPYEAGGELLSSSRIRGLIRDGAVDEAAHLLTRPYSVTAEIIHGREIGRGIGYPTLNQRIPGEKIVPAYGAYAAAVSVGGKTYRGVSNIGFRPTVNDDCGDVTLETHVIGYDGDAYGERATVSLLKMLRTEMKFPSADALAEQIGRDIAAAEEYFAKS